MCIQCRRSLPYRADRSARYGKRRLDCMRILYVRTPDMYVAVRFESHYVPRSPANFDPTLTPLELTNNNANLFGARARNVVCV